MRKFALLLLLSLTAISNAQEKIQWMSIEEAYALTLTEASPKKIFIDVYTDWCGWCKRMDKATFQKPEVAAYMNEHYYNVKFDAEQKESIEMLGNTFKFIPQGNRGYHELAAALLNGKMSYPTVVFMNPKFEMLSPVPGYQEAGPFMNIAKYFGDNIYTEKSWQDYSQQ
ncbi:MAG: Thiol:disulfide interchange protein DsbD [Flavobacteriales bacterium UBA4585]|nr:MAG: Thiol:disulfide interchange protein DsbD [Flavobacteriales bacterium UBA4585]